MAKSLVIVESPAKAKTIKRYLGKDFNVEASSGHLVDLPSSKLGVDIEKNFKPHYVVIKDKKKFLNQLEKAAKGAEKIYLASDPDREGEAIAWHIVDRLKLKDRAYRVLIHEITEKAILEAIRKPTSLSRDRFEAQQARRILDRLVGYQVSPILWKKVRGGLSAGRVQSVALRLVVEREREIEAFKPEEYWTIEAEVKQLPDDALPLVTTLAKYDGEKVEIKNEDQARRIVEALRNEKYTVLSVERKERTRTSPPPFITSTLQQEASRKLRFPVKKTMAIAQRLYEGLELGDEGLGGDDDPQADQAVEGKPRPRTRRAHRMRARSMVNRLSGRPSASRTTSTTEAWPLSPWVGNQYVQRARNRPSSRGSAVRSFWASVGATSRPATTSRGTRWRAKSSRGPSRVTRSTSRPDTSRSTRCSSSGRTGWSRKAAWRAASARR